MTVKELDSSPSMAGLFARAGAGAIPLASRLPFVPTRSKELPDLTLVLNDVPVDRDRLARYDHVCGFDLSDTLPPTYPHMLAFPLHLALMTDGSFPFAAIGLVHIANRITQHRPLRADERLNVKVWPEALRDHPRGRQFDLRTEVRAGDELVWEETSTNLRRGGGSKDVESSEEPLPSVEDLPAAATWKLAGDLGRRYGSVSGDMNPIHIHPLTARLFGFPSAIAHGMWTKARCLAALEPRLPDAFSVRVEFKKPIVLPATVTYAEQGNDFGVRSDAPHLEGQVSSG